MGTKATKAVLLGAAAAAALIVWTVGIRRLDSIWFSIEDVGASIMALTTAEKQALGLPEAPPWIGHYLPRAA